MTVDTNYFKDERDTWHYDKYRVFKSFILLYDYRDTVTTTATPSSLAHTKQKDGKSTRGKYMREEIARKVARVRVTAPAKMTPKQK